MRRERGYIDENGEWHEPMTKAEAKASIEDMHNFMEWVNSKPGTDYWWHVSRNDSQVGSLLRHAATGK